jgi:adenylate cyclase
MSATSPSTAIPSAVPSVGSEERIEAERLLAARRAEGNLKIARIATIAVLVSVPFSLGILVALDRQMGLLFLVLEAAVLAYAIALGQLCRRGLYRPWHDVPFTAIEASIPTAVVLIDVARIGPAYALTSGATSALYAAAIFVSALRLRPRLSLLSGAVAGAELLLVTLSIDCHLPAEQVAILPSLSVSNLAQRAAYLLFAGLCAQWLGNSLRGALAELVVTTRRELRVRSILGRQVTPQVANLLLGPEARAAAGEKRTVTLLFCDLRNFTSFSERRDPAEVVALLDELLAAACEAVHWEGGIVNKFLGDGLMAIFGAPAPDPEHARHALDAARRIGAELGRLRAAHGLAELEVGIGIHSGEAVVGLVGSEERSEYTAIGDAVNLASRIEGLNKQFGTNILLSAESVHLLGEGAPVRRVGEAQVKGRVQPVEVWEPAEAETLPIASRPASA